MKPVSEKAAEILFNRFLLQSFPLGTIELFAPSSFEEFKSGYDSKLSGHSAFREMYLQFKSPTYSSRRNLFTISVTQHQHQLLRAYPFHSAYYVAPMFRTLRELNEAQRDLTVAIDFLKDYVCIEISGLPAEVNFFQFVPPESHRESPQVTYKIPADGGTRTATHAIQGSGWMRGSGLVTKFRDNEIGNAISLDPSQVNLESDSISDDSELGSPVNLARPLSASEFGVVVRKDVRHTTKLLSGRGHR